MNCLSSLQKLSKFPPVAYPLLRASSVLAGSSFSHKQPAASPSVRLYSDKMKEKRLKWGLLGSGLICNDFTISMSNLKHEHEIYAVAEHNNKGLADKFAENFNLQKSYGDFKEIVSDPNVDICYIATRNRYHFPAAKMAIEHGKHCIVEKPFACTPAEARELFRLAKERKVFIMEALWSNFTPAYERLRELLKSDVIGKLVHVQATYADNIYLDRVVYKKFGGGVILDIGVYALNALLTAVDYAHPTKVKAVGNLYPDDNDSSEKAEVTVSASLEFPGGVTAGLLITGNVSHDYIENSNDTIFYGTKGYIKLSSMVNCPSYIEVNGVKEDTSADDNNQGYNWVNTFGLRYQAHEVRRCILANELTSSQHKPEHTLCIADCMAALHEEIGQKVAPTIETYDFKNL